MRSTESRTASIDLPEARKYIKRRYGVQRDLSSLWRYAIRGQAGVTLGHIRIGRKMLTTRGDIDRFFMELANAHAARLTAPTTAPASSARHDQAERELDAAGV